MTTLHKAAQQALEALNSIDVGYRSPSGDPLEVSFDEVKCEAAIAALRAALAQEQAEPVQEPVAWLQPKTVSGHLRPDLGYESCSSADYGAFPVYRVPPRCPNCASLEAQNDELDRKLAEMEQAYENGYKAGVAAEREECAKVCDFHVARLSAIDEPRPALAVGICAAAIRARGNT